MKRFLKVMSVSLGFAAILGLSIGASAFAFTPGQQNADSTCAVRGGAGFHAGEQICDAAIADILGITQQQLCELRLEGVTLADIAVSMGIDLDEFTDALVEAKTNTILAALEAGTITPEQSEVMLANVENRVEAMLYRLAGSGGQGPIGEGMGNQHRGNKAGIGLGECGQENALQNKAGNGNQHRGNKAF